MSDLNQKLDRFTAALMAQASADTARTLDEVRQRRAQAMSAAEDGLLLEAYQYIHDQVAQIKQEVGCQVSRHMLAQKRKLYLRREEIALEIFGQVEKKIIAFTQTPAYAARLTALLQEALSALGSGEEVTLYLRPQDRALVPKLTPLLPPGAQVADGSFTLGGLMVQAGSRRADCSFDSGARALSGHLAELFGLSLAGGEVEA